LIANKTTKDAAAFLSAIKILETDGNWKHANILRLTYSICAKFRSLILNGLEQQRTNSSSYSYLCLRQRSGHRHCFQSVRASVRPCV